MMYLVCIDLTKKPQDNSKTIELVNPNDVEYKQKKKEREKEHIKYDRDSTIYRLYKAGVDINEIAFAYNIQAQRIKSIIQDYRVKLRKGNPDIYEIDAMCRILGWRENERGKLQSTLHKNGYTSFDDKWRELTYEDILEIPLLGPNAANVIWLAQNMDSS